MATKEKTNFAEVKATPMKAFATATKQSVKPPFKVGLPTPPRPRTPSTPKTLKVDQVQKPAWKRRPPAAHSGVPVPEKMRKLFEKLRKERQAAADEKARTATT